MLKRRRLLRRHIGQYLRLHACLPPKTVILCAVLAPEPAPAACGGAAANNGEEGSAWVTAGWSPTGADARGSGHAAAAGNASSSAVAGAPESSWAGTPDAAGSLDGRPAQAPGPLQSEALAVHARSYAADTRHHEHVSGGDAAPRFRGSAPAQDMGGKGPPRAPERARAGAPSAGSSAGAAGPAGRMPWEHNGGGSVAGAGDDASLGAPAGPAPAGGALNAGQRWWRGGPSEKDLEEAMPQEEAASSHPGAALAAEDGAGRLEAAAAADMGAVEEPGGAGPAGALVGSVEVSLAASTRTKTLTLNAPAVRRPPLPARAAEPRLTPPARCATWRSAVLCSALRWHARLGLAHGG